MNKKKNQTSIDLDAIMTEVLNLFTPEEQQEVIDILSNNGLEKIYQQMEEAFYHYQHPDYSLEATPIAAYLQRLWDMQTCKDYPFDEFKKDCTTVPAAELEKICATLSCIYLSIIKDLSKTQKKKTDLLSYGISTGQWNITEWNLL